MATVRKVVVISDKFSLY